MDKRIIQYSFRPEATIRLFCFPPAGGGASLFRNWPSVLPNLIEVYAIQLPGRESNIAEAPLRDYQQAVDVLTEHLTSYIDKPFAFFGHSMGALLAYGVTCTLRARSARTPVCMIVSGVAAPPFYQAAITDSQSPLERDDEQLIQEFKELAAPTEAILTNQDFLSLLLPTIRADFSICHSFHTFPGEPLPCSISAYGGLQDELTRTDLEAWNKQTARTFRVRMFPGGHHYIWQSEQLLLAQVAKDILSAI